MILFIDKSINWRSFRSHCGWIISQVAFGEDTGMNNSVGIGFDNDYGPMSSSEPVPVSDSNLIPIPTPKPKAKSKVLPQIDEAVGSSTISWLGLVMIAVVISRFRQKKNT